MARLRLVTATDPALLLRHAASGFLVRGKASPNRPYPTVDYLLALRQGGLRDDVIALMAGAGVPGFFDPPLCIFHELPERLGAPSRATLGVQERRVLLGAVLREVAPNVFGKVRRPDDFVDSVDALFGELIGESVAPAEFAAALARRPDRDEFELARDTDLDACFALYHARLATLAKADGRDAWRHCAASIAAEPAALTTALGGRREIRIFGLADLRGGWRILLATLAQSPALDDIVVYSATRLPLAPLGALHEPLGEPDSAARRLFAGIDAEPVAGSTAIVVAPDVERELDEVARRIRNLIVERGVPPHRIAIVSRKARPHVDLALASLARFGVPAIARRRIGLAEIPSVRAVRSMFAAAASGWTRAGLVELARHPYVECELDTRVLDVIGYRRRVVGLAAWEKAIRALEHEAKQREARVADGEEVRGRALPPAACITATRECFGPFAARARALDTSRSLIGWLDWLADFLDRDAWGIARRMKVLPLERFDVVRRDLAGWDQLVGLVNEWRTALAELGSNDESLTVAEFDEQLRGMLEGDVALWTPKRRGVQVLEAMAAAYRSFDHVFLVGMEAGQFPSPASRSPVLDEVEREALVAGGMPLDPAAVRDERERDLFRVLVAGATHSLTVSYACMDANGSEVIRSAFVEELADVAVCAEYALPASDVMIRGAPLYLSDGARDQALLGAVIERERAVGAASAYDGAIGESSLLEWLAVEFGENRIWSPTQLEEFAKCPWSYFSKRLLGMERLEDPSEDIEPNVRGTILHDALKRFFDSAGARVGGPVFLRAGDAEWAFPLLERSVTDAWSAAAEGQWLGHPTLETAKRAELQRIARGYLEWEIDLHETMTDPSTKKRNAPKMIRTGVVQHELSFDDMRYEHDGIAIRYRGSIDRVELSDGVDDRLDEGRFVAAVDYKSSKGATPGKGDTKAWDEGVVLQVPLYALALSRLYPTHEVARVEYVPLGKPEHVHQLQPYTFDKKSGSVLNDEDAEDQWKIALRRAVEQVRRTRQGEFPAAPPSTCGCPPWCQGRDVCRVKPEGAR